MKQILSMAGIGLLGGLVLAGWMPRQESSAVQAAPAVAQTAAYSENQPGVTDGAPQFRLVADRDDDDYYRNDWHGRNSYYRNNPRYSGNYGYNNGYYNNSYPAPPRFDRSLRPGQGRIDAPGAVVPRKQEGGKE